MSKAEKIANEVRLVLNQEEDKHQKLIDLLKQHLMDAHSEAVDATVMAMNKQRFIKPEYKD